MDEKFDIQAYMTRGVERIVADSFYCSEKGQANLWSSCRAFIREAPAGCRGSRNEMPSPGKGDTMGMVRAGDGFPTPATRQHIEHPHE